MRGLLKTVARNITLDLIYETVEERTHDLKEDIRDLRQGMGQLRQEVKSELDQVRQEMAQMRQEVKSELDQVRQEMAQMRQEINHLNGRFDQLFTAILNLYEKSAKDK